MCVCVCALVGVFCTSLLHIVENRVISESTCLLLLCDFELCKGEIAVKNVFFFSHNDSTEYLPSHLPLLTASLTTATVPAQTLSVCKSVIDHSTSTGRTEIESGVPLFDC